MTIKISPTRARNTFINSHGEQAYNVLRMLFDGYSTAHIASKMQMSRRSVAAFAANFTRGTYQTWIGWFQWKPAYDQVTRDAVAQFRAGQTTTQVAQALKLTMRSAAAYAANFTRGTYDNLA